MSCLIAAVTRLRAHLCSTCDKRMGRKPPSALGGGEFAHAKHLKDGFGDLRRRDALKGSAREVSAHRVAVKMPTELCSPI